MADMDKRCYSVAELQEILGVSRQCIYELLKKKEIQLGDGRWQVPYFQEKL